MRTITIISRLIIAILGAGLFAGCAGPTTPFGAVPLRRSAFNHDEGIKHASETVADDDDDDDDTAVASSRRTSNQPTSVSTTTTLHMTSADSAKPSDFTRQPAEPQQVIVIGSAAAAAARAPSSVLATTGPERIMQLQPQITFYPKRHILHGKATFKIVIDDPMGIKPEHELMLTYNGINVTRRFMWQSHIDYEGGEPATRMKITMYNLRLLPTKENRIDVIYWRQPHAQPVFAKYFPPSCSAFKEDKILTTGNFEVPSKLVDQISQAADSRHINPAILAGLIAQESGFNPRAVSYAKALGLTQITPLGEEEVIKNVNDPWPRYPNINRMTIPLLKYRVMSGKIHGGNEWRLNPQYSIAGGAAYLMELSDYWKRPQNMSVVSHYFKNTDSALSQLILASYNSGATRVNQALQSHGRRWLQDDKDLGEARKYVRRVISYCDYFSRAEEDEDAKAP
jgi:hypothetical protein